MWAGAGGEDPDDVDAVVEFGVVTTAVAGVGIVSVSESSVIAPRDD